MSFLRSLNNVIYDLGAVNHEVENLLRIVVNDTLAAGA